MSDGPPSTDATLLVGIPSKGRLQENANAFFARAGLAVKQAGGREYRGRLAGIDNAEVAFLSAGEIATRLAEGSLHFGITGEDLIRERIPDADEAVDLLVPLGFGHADVVVAVPQSWIDVASMADLDDVALAFHARHGRRLRVATKYLTLTRSFFADHGISDYRIVESLGATEGAPAAGSAEAIVDITTTGATLAANRLKILEDGLILKSEANLVASLTAPWSEHVRAAARQLLAHIAAEAKARRSVEVQVRLGVGEGALFEELRQVFGCDYPFGLDAGGGTVTLICEEKRLYPLIQRLEAAGKETILVSKADYVFSAENPLIERLASRLSLSF